MSKTDDALRLIYKKIREEEREKRKYDVINKLEVYDYLMSVWIQEPEDDFNEGIRVAASVIWNFEPAQLEKEKGKWLPFGHSWDPPMGTMCSKCGFKRYNKMHAVFGGIGWNFCPSCGVDMRGEENGN